MKPARNPVLAGIERAGKDAVPFRVPAAPQRPDHATIARCLERHEEAIADLFG